MRLKITLGHCMVDNSFNLRVKKGHFIESYSHHTSIQCKLSIHQIKDAYLFSSLIRQLADENILFLRFDNLGSNGEGRMGKR